MLFKLEGVRQIYGNQAKTQKVALDIPRLSLEAGATYGFVGPNGSGKTTLLSILAGLLKPTEGHAWFEGKPVSTKSRYIKSRRKMTLVMQSPWLFRGTVRFNVAYGLRARGLNRQESISRTSQALHEVGLSGFEERKVSGLSGGEVQRVALARALSLKPEVLLLDEPTSNLDLESSISIEQIMAQISSSHRTLIFTTHHPALATAWRVNPYSIEKGRLLPPESHTKLTENPQKETTGHPV